MKFLKRIRFFVIYSLILSILYIPSTTFASWSGSAYSPGETLNPECAPTDSGCTVSLSFTASNGNIGIGTTSPYARLSVVGELVSSYFTATSSTATSTIAGGLKVLGDNGLSVFLSGASTARVAIGTSTSSSVLDVYSAGNAQFITDRPFGNASAVALRLIGLSSTNNASTGFGPSLNFNTEDSDGNVLSNTGAVANVWENAVSPNRTAALTFQTLTSGSNGATEKVRITGAGNLGIGTTSPFATLAINPTAGNASNQFVIGSSTATSFVVDNTGRVGIGTSTALRSLDIVDKLASFFPVALYTQAGTKNGEITTGTDTTRQIGFNLPVTSGGTISGDGWVQFRFNAAGNKIFFGDTGTNAWIQSMHKMNFYANSSAPGTTTAPFVTFDTTGNVGIGTTSPYSVLSISNTVSTTAGTPLLTIASTTAGTATTTFMTVLANGNIGIATTSPSSLISIKQNANTSSNGIWQSGTDGDFRSIYMSDTSGTLSFFGGDTAGALNTATLSSAGTWTNASDRSYKENIANLDTKYNLNTLLSIQPRFYTMKGSGKPQIGFIAQELQPILPEVVEGTEGSLGISYGNMVALLVQAIKDINTKVDNLATIVSDKVKIMFGEKVETKRLCLEGLCITRDELQRILYTTNVNGIYEQTIPSSTNNQQNNSNNSSNNSTNQNTTNNNVGTSTEQTNNSTTTPQSNINPADNSQGSTTPATIPETPPETPIEQPVPPQTPDTSSTTPNTLP